MHTRLPWKVDPEKPATLLALDFYSESGVCTCWGLVPGTTMPSQATAEANARFLEVAVNSHYDLLAAAEAAQPLLAIAATGAVVTGPSMDKICAMLGAAIAKAKGAA